MFKIAKEEFNVKATDLYTLDALKALEIISKKKKKYDLILIDVYWSNWEVPEYFQDKIFIDYLRKII